jgi:nucleotide-binding universal stress UspA family protein
MILSHIVVASDLTERSDRALARALQLMHEPLRLTVLHVVASGLPPELEEEQERSAESFLARRLRHVSPEGAAGCGSVVLTGGVFSTIIAEAITRAADLIVIGKPGHHPYADLFTGTTAERVIRFSDRPVLMVKQPAREPYRRVLVAFDGSEGVVRAFQMALAIAPDAEFRVVHAWWSPHVSLEEMEAAKQQIHDENNRLKKLIADAVRQAITASGTAAKVTIDLVENNPYMVVANQCSWADLLVTGTHSKGRLASTASIGNLARHLLIEASCDVLTSRP